MAGGAGRESYQTIRRISASIGRDCIKTGVYSGAIVRARQLRRKRVWYKVIACVYLKERYVVCARGREGERIIG